MPVKEVGFEILHCHTTEGSHLDGVAQTSEYAEYSKEVNQKYLCITDHGMMSTVPQAIRECEKHNLEWIAGCELYINPLQPMVPQGQKTSEFIKDWPEDMRKKMARSYHLLAIAKNNVGFSNLVKICSFGFKHGFYYKPRINYEVLQQYKEGILFSTCCFLSEIGQAFDLEGKEVAEAKILKYIDMLGKENYMAEIMLLDFHKQRAYNEFIITMALKYGLRIVVTTDSHYCRKEDAETQRKILCINSGRTIHEVNALIAKSKAEGDYKILEDIFEMQDSGLFKKSEFELNQYYELNYQDSIPPEIFQLAKENTVKVCEMAKGVQLDRSIKLPKFDNENEKLLEEIQKGFKKRGLPQTKEYEERIREEYDLICQKEFASYFLIQKMMVDAAVKYWAEKTGGSGAEAKGPGRGCLNFDTEIITGQGVKKISEVEIGDMVYTMNGVLKKVLNRFEYPCDESLIYINTSYGSGVKLTKDHRVLVAIRKYGNFQWMKAEDVEVGYLVYAPNICIDKMKPVFGIKKDNGIGIEVMKVSIVEGTGKVYDLQVEDEHNYMTTSFLVHNSAPGSLIMYAIGVTDVNPIDHGLLFSRFLSPARGGKQMKLRFTQKPI